MFYIIYQTKNKITNSIYIGQHKTNDLNDGYLGSGLILGRAIAKYGKENFEKTILYFCNSQEELNEKEKELVNEEFVNRPDTYNITLGGGSWFHCNGKNHNNKHNYRKTGFLQKTNDGIYPIAKWLNSLSDVEFKEYCKHISDAVKKHISIFGSWWSGKHHSEETKQKMHETHLKNHHQQGSKNSQYGKHWWKDPNDKTKSMPIKEGDSIPEGWIKGRWGKKLVNKN